MKIDEKKKNSTSSIKNTNGELPSASSLIERLALKNKTLNPSLDKLKTSSANKLNLQKPFSDVLQEEGFKGLYLRLYSFASKNDQASLNDLNKFAESLSGKFKPHDDAYWEQRNLKILVEAYGNIQANVNPVAGLSASGSYGSSYLGSLYKLEIENSLKLEANNSGSLNIAIDLKNPPISQAF